MEEGEEKRQAVESNKRRDNYERQKEKQKKVGWAKQIEERQEKEIQQSEETEEDSSEESQQVENIVTRINKSVKYLTRKEQQLITEIIEKVLRTAKTAKKGGRTGDTFSSNLFKKKKREMIIRRKECVPTPLHGVIQQRRRMEKEVRNGQTTKKRNKEEWNSDQD